MLEIDISKKTSPLLTAFTGFALYLAGGLAICLIILILSLIPNLPESVTGITSLFIPIVGAATGGLLLGYMLRVPAPVKTCIRSIAGEVAGVACGGFIGFMILWIIVHNNGSENIAWGVADVVAGVIMNSIHGYLIAEQFYGKGAKKFFAKISAIAAIVFGLAVVFPFVITMPHAAGSDLMGIGMDGLIIMLAVPASLGMTTGLSIGIYGLKKAGKE